MTSKAELDYLVAIYQIEKNKGIASTTDIAKILHIKSPSVTDMLTKLHKKDLILYKKYQGARLSKAGVQRAKSSISNHQVFKKFLKRILIPDTLIEKDAYVLEQGLSPTTMRQFCKFVRFMEMFGENPCFFVHFQNYCKDPSKSQKFTINCKFPRSN